MSVLDMEKQPAERRVDAISRGTAKEFIQDHSTGCPAHHGLREVQKEIQELWKKIILVEVLDNRITAVENALETIEADIATTMIDIHKIQTSMAEANIIHLWVGRVVIAILSAGLTFVAAKYGSPV